MCVVTGITALGAGIATALSATASAAATAATAAGSAIMAAGSGLASLGATVGSGIMSAGSALVSGAQTVGSAALSGLKAAGSAIASGMQSAGSALGIGGEGAAVGGAGAVPTSVAPAAGATVAAPTPPMIGAPMAGLGAPAGASTTGGAVATSTGQAVSAGLTPAEKVALGIGLAGGAVSGATSAMQAYQEGQAAKERAKIEQQQAENERIRAGQEMEAGARDALDLARKAKQAKGTGRAAMAANGVMMESREGSTPAMYESDADIERAYDQTKIMQNAALRAWGYNANASILDAQAAETRRTGRMRSRLGYVSAASSAISSGVSMYGASKTLLT